MVHSSASGVGRIEDFYYPPIQFVFELSFSMTVLYHQAYPAHDAKRAVTNTTVKFGLNFRLGFSRVDLWLLACIVQIYYKVPAYYYAAATINILSELASTSYPASVGLSRFVPVTI